MISLDLSHFDQTAVFFSVVSALALIRERRILPFLMVAAGAVFLGPLVLAAIAALVAWHRADRGACKWVQLKDLCGMFFLAGAALSTDALQAFFLFFGVFLVVANFSGGMLGTLPGVLLLRQAHPHPEFLEATLGVGAFFWVLKEVFRFVKTPHEAKILGALELVFACVVLANFRAESEKILSEPAFIGAGALILLLALSLAFWKRAREEGFWSFGDVGRLAAARPLLAGDRILKPGDRLAGDAPVLQEVGFSRSLDRLVYWLFGIVLFAVAFILLSKGGVFNDF